MFRIGLDARLTHYREGGITQYIYHLIRELSLQDAVNDYLILHSRKDQRNLAEAANQRRITCWTPPHHRLERLALAAEVFPLRLNLLHSPDFIPPHNGNYRSVITVHDLTFLHYPEYLTAASRRYYNAQIEAAVARADHVLTDSEASRIDILNLLNVSPEKVTTTWLGISEHFKRPAPNAMTAFQQEHNLPAGYLLSVGTIEPRKNLAGLLRAYAHLRRDLPDLPPLVLAGKAGWLYEDIFQLRDELGLSEAVHWLENVSYAELPALYSGASVLCTPSFYEGFGFPPLEAMACGTPVVVADRSSLPEVVGDTGILVNPDDVDSIADGLQRVLTDTALAEKLRQQGKERVKLFDWRDTARKTLTVYNKVLEA